MEGFEPSVGGGGPRWRRAIAETALTTVRRSFGPPNLTQVNTASTGDLDVDWLLEGRAAVIVVVIVASV